MKIYTLICCLALVGSMASAPSFANAESEKAVVEKVEFDGHCAMGVCEGHFVKADLNVKLERDGKVYCFSNESAKNKFEKNYDANLKKAHAQWKKFIARGGAHAQ